MRLPYVFLFLFAAMVMRVPAAAQTNNMSALFGVTVAPADATTGDASPPERQPPALQPKPVPSPLRVTDEMVMDKDSYMTIFDILHEKNACSDFFGGPAKAVEVFNQFVRHMRRKSLESPTVGIRMKGAFTNYQDQLTGAEYRLFEQTIVNSEGPFFNALPAHRVSQATVGSFPVKSRQARALLVLHELGHLVRGADGDWVLPNDGGNPSLSAQNTREVEDHCLDQLVSLKN